MYTCIYVYIHVPVAVAADDPFSHHPAASDNTVEECSPLPCEMWSTVCNYTCRYIGTCIYNIIIHIYMYVYTHVSICMYMYAVDVRKYMYILLYTQTQN